MAEGYYDPETGEWIEGLPDDDDEELRMPWSPPAGGASWDTILPEGGSWGPVPSSPVGAALARQRADAAERAYRRAQQEYEAAVTQSATDEGYAGNLPALKGRVDNARWEWDRLDDIARGLEKTEAAAPKAGASGGFMTPGTGSRYIGRVKPDGGIVWEDNPNYRPPTSGGGVSSAAALGQLKVAQDRLDWQMAQAVEKQDWEQYKYLQNRQDEMRDALAKAEGQAKLEEQKAQALAARERQERDWERAKTALSAQMNVYGQISGQIPEMLKYAIQPGQKYYTGAEPGGFFENYLKGTGMTHDPEKYKVVPIDYNPAAQWDKAMEMLRAWWESQSGEEG